MIIAPSLLSCDFLNIETELSYFRNTSEVWLHLDVMDGHFVPNLTFGPPIVKRISEKTNLPLDVHCMVSNPKWHIEAYKEIKIHNLTFHLEADPDPLKLLKMAKSIYPSVGLSIKPSTSVSKITDDILRNLTKRRKSPRLGSRLATKERILRVINQSPTYGYAIWKSIGSPYWPIF